MSCTAVREADLVSYDASDEWATGTKYFGGHSDLLCGVLVVPTLEKWKQVRRTAREKNEYVC